MLVTIYHGSLTLNLNYGLAFIIIRYLNNPSGYRKWRYDGRCGFNYHLPDGTPGQCDPDGDKPCCNDDWDGECGNTTEHCTCYSCTNYTRLYRDWEESGGTQKWRYDGRCGSKYALLDGTPNQCNPDGDRPCCSSDRYGWCGNTAKHCSCSSCTNYTFVRDWWKSGGTQKWKYDGKCGSYFPLPDGTPGQCDPDGDKPCCNNTWSGECGNTAKHCSCSDCTNYTRLYRDWEESGGTKKWRYDGRCGSYYPLPDGTPGQCDPDGDKPCCSSNSWNGECGSTTKHCTCRDCTDYKLLKEWNESNGTQKWRYDGRCGRDYPLPNGTPAQCDPDGDKPCCGQYGGCGYDDHDQCLCTHCVDYRVVREIKNSGKKCTGVKIQSGFLKHVCFDEGHWKLYFKCVHSEQDYTVRYVNDIWKASMYRFKYVSKVCGNDQQGYQACGFPQPFYTKITNTDVLCGGYICEEKEGGTHQYIRCSGDNCKPENRDCKQSRDTTSTCNDECDHEDGVFFCEDESHCNGFYYGLSCAQVRYSYSGNHLPVHQVCDGDKQCNDGSDELNCTVTDSTVYTCTHFWGKVWLSKTVTVPIHNYTRCSLSDTYRILNPYCLDFLDQTNCSDIERVGGYCKVNGFMSTVSKYMLCYEYDLWTGLAIKLCDDGFENNCVNISTSDCRVHKHWMCDGVKDCPDGTDEIHDMCKTMTDKQHLICKRRFDKMKGIETSIPVTWILDNEKDCMNGEDENVTRWKVCSGEIKKVLLTGESCQNFYKCSHNVESFVPFDHLCDGVESCGDETENRVCRIARDFPNIDKVVNYADDATRDFCRDLGITKTCEIREFGVPWSPSEVFGLDRKMLVNVPTTQINCTDLFGEHYLFLSCMELCSEENATCPLKNTRKLQYGSCPGQFPDRAITLADNSFLTFVNKSSRGDYHQEFYQCNNGQCIEYKQVCDLVDDCGDMSDEINCTNHIICEDTKNSTRHHFISLTKQKCDGIYDCFDLSDECNESCSRQVLEFFVLKCMCWLMGILALAFNFYVICNGLSSIKDCQTESMMVSKLLMSLIGSGDFLIGLYLIILSVYDSLIFGKDFCRKQAEWLTGTACLTLGVISTVGSQISLFSMTLMSFIRMYGLIYRSMRIPGPVNKKAVTKVVLLCSSIIFLSLAVAVIPLVPSLEDYFVQGMYYDSAYKVFIGFPNKDRHIKVLEEYYPDQISSDLSWSEIGEKVDGMFTQDFVTLSRRPVHFYGNDGVCLFKYFVRTDDARRSRQSPGSGAKMNDPVVWIMLVVNLICFIIMTYCYIRIIRNTRQSTQTSGQYDNPERLRENRAMEQRIMVIIITDFMCWVPFIFISGLHNLGAIDASDWYTSFAMIVLPLNSVINPLIYDKQLGGLIMRKLGQVTKVIRHATSPITGLLRPRRNDQETEMVPMEIISHPQT